jgi:hypothetical protein
VSQEILCCMNVSVIRPKSYMFSLESCLRWDKKILKQFHKVFFKLSEF